MKAWRIDLCAFSPGMERAGSLFEGFRPAVFTSACISFLSIRLIYRHVYTLRQRPDLYINYEYFKADVSFAQNELKEKRSGL